MTYNSDVMSESLHIYLAKAEESLLGAQSELDQGRWNNSANRCYYACFQAAITALQQAVITPPSGRNAWGHAFVQAAFVGQLVNRRKLYPVRLRQVLVRNMALRQAADYEPDHVSRVQVERALQRSREFIHAIREKVNADEQPGHRS